MTVAGKKSRSRAHRKPKSEGGVESSSRWGCKERPSRGRWVVVYVEEIGGALKWRGKFEWKPIITHKVYLNKQKEQQKQKKKQTNTNSNKKNKETRNPKRKLR